MGEIHTKNKKPQEKGKESSYTSPRSKAPRREERLLSFSALPTLLLLISCVSLSLPAEYTATGFLRLSRKKLCGLDSANLIIELAYSRKVLERLCRECGLSPSPESLAALRKGLRLEVRGEGCILAIGFTHRDRFLSARVVNSLADLLSSPGDLLFSRRDAYGESLRKRMREMEEDIALVREEREIFHNSWALLSPAGEPLRRSLYRMELATRIIKLELEMEWLGQTGPSGSMRAQEKRELRNFLKESLAGLEEGSAPPGALVDFTRLINHSRRAESLLEIKKAGLLALEQEYGMLQSCRSETPPDWQFAQRAAVPPASSCVARGAAVLKASLGLNRKD